MNVLLINEKNIIKIALISTITNANEKYGLEYVFCLIAYAFHEQENPMSILFR